MAEDPRTTDRWEPHGRPAPLTRRTLVAAAPIAVAGLAVAGRATGTGTTPNPRPRPATPAIPTEPPPAPPFTEDLVASLMDDLALAGVAVFAAADDLDPVVPVDGPASLRLLAAQARSMAVEVSAGGGLTGADLDGLAGFPDLPAGTTLRRPDPRAAAFAGIGAAVTGADPADAPLSPVRPSQLLVAWVVAGDTPSADAARAYLPAVADDPEAALAGAMAVRFPGIVLALFAGELARADDALPGAASVALTRPATIACGPVAVPGVVAPGVAGAGVALAAAWQASPCSAVTGFVDGTIAALTGALRKGIASLGLPEFLTLPLGFLLGWAEDAVRSLISSILAPLLAPIRAIAEVVGVGVMVVSAIRPWTLRVQPTPLTSFFAVGSGPDRTGTVRSTVDLGGADEWPPMVADCAAAAGVPLPPLKPEGARVTWRVVPSRADLITVTDQAEETDADGSAEMTFRTGRESEEQARGPARVGTVDVSTTVARPQFDELRDTILNLAFGALPEVVQPFVRSILGPPADELLRKITSLTDSRGGSTLWVIYHDPPEPEPSDEPGAAGTVSATFELALDTVTSVQLGLEATTCDGVDWSGELSFSDLSDPDETEGVFTITISGRLPIAWSFADGDSATVTVGTYRGEATTIYSEDTVEYTVDFDLAIGRVPDDDTGGTAAITVDGVMRSTSDGIPGEVALAGNFTGIGEEIPVTATDAC